jgi:PAS domain-containing protein
VQLEAFEAALRLIMPGPGDQPLMRIINIARQVADCPIAYLAARRPVGTQIIVSSGIPLTQFRETLPPSKGIFQHFLRPTIIEDATQVAPFASESPFVAGALGLRYFASLPLPLATLPFPVTLTCADNRTGVVRADDLLVRLEDCTYIAADELRLIGDIALHTETVSATRSTIAALKSFVDAAQMPMALLDQSQHYLAASERLLGLINAEESDLLGTPISDTISIYSVELGRRFGDVLASGMPLTAFRISSYDGQRTYLLDAYRCTVSDEGTYCLVVSLTDRSHTMHRVAALDSTVADSAGVVSDFLLATVIRQKRLLRRGAVPYHALVRWRASVKDAQVAALRAIKKDPCERFVNHVADDIAAAAGALYGRGTFRAVVPVPCGSSGANCLAARLASRTAKLLGVDLIEAFAPLPEGGASHPKKNARRPTMKLAVQPDVPVLLVDDVATSGAHIEEASMLLRKSAPAVLPMVWIAD